MKKHNRNFMIAYAIVIALVLIAIWCGGCQKEEDPQPVETVGDAVIYIEEHV